ncbi:HAMP domain-containing histidine kinase [Brevibacillus ruminantium]|uniref:histidine kinase n=1 Tax=Brevibacillus ruminantium TaxID=2950604 RepID=A0ABY4WJW2_9BACL|nr:HAMP domain-containing sensor histidine kinase [Brevibacillus ruminantium]USG66443.1 HAMP domain-containing histidine kinase [Brevibacillus ruminantium]
MKLKRWLLLTHLVIMLLPVAALFVLYGLINAFDQSRDVKEFVQASQKIGAIEQKLQDPSLYQIQPPQHYQAIAALSSHSVSIELYRIDGTLLYSSLDQGSLPYTRLQTERKRNLYDLHELRKNTRTYSVKKLVDRDSEMVGFYQITLAREEWLDGVRERGIWLAGSLAIFLILLYVTVVYLLNRKLNRPVALLMKQMTAFAQNLPIPANEHRSKDEIGEVLAHFEKMRESIDKARLELVHQQQEKEYMVASLSHDLKTPLTSIRAYAEALHHDTGLSNQERREYVSILFDKIDYMKQILDDLTMYTALRSSQGKTEQVAVDGEEFFETVLSGYEELCRKNGILLRTETAVAGTCELQPQQIMRLIDNLMSNAMRYTQAGKQIWLAAYSENQPLPPWIFPPCRPVLEEWGREGVMVIVQNEGEAIPAEQLPRIFEAFYQADPARTKKATHSTGLGLSIAKMIMDHHQGEIRIWSKAPYGTMVACWMPYRKDESN